MELKLKINNAVRETKEECNLIAMKQQEPKIMITTYAFQ